MPLPRKTTFCGFDVAHPARIRKVNAALSFFITTPLKAEGRRQKCFARPPSASSSFSLLLSAFSLQPFRPDPPIHIRLQHAQRNRAAAEDHVVELANVEAGTERLLGALAELFDLQLAELVGKRLAWPGDIAVDLGLDFVK